MKNNLKLTDRIYTVANLAVIRKDIRHVYTYITVSTLIHTENLFKI